MKTVRTNVFETNSSSTHSIIIPRNRKVRKQEKRKIVVATIGEYGWEYETYYDLLSYIYTALCCIYKDKYEKYTKKIENVAQQYNIEIVWEKPEFNYIYDKDDNITYCYLENGYIDHDDELVEFLEDLFNDDELLIDTILSGYVKTGNDNDGWDDDDYDETTEDCYYYYKGN